LNKKYIIFNCTARPAGGLADRLKGLVSTYALSKKLNREFIVNWTFPQKLNTVLEPNKYNWLPRPIQGFTQKDYFLIDNDSFNQHKHLFSPVSEMNFPEDLVTIRTNINFLPLLNMTESFADLFEELFKPKFTIPSLQEYVGFSARFGGTQSNWADSDFDRVVTYDYAFESLQEQMSKNKNKKLFICTDSSAFLEFLKDKGVDFLTTEGYAEHIDHEGCTEQGFKKVFEDFFILRQCDPILTIKGEFAKTVIGSFPTSKTLVTL
jgi:hypothetical protein